MMMKFKEQLLNVLCEIKGSGSFVSSGTESFVFPGLTIRGIDEISYPINANQVKEMVKVAHKAAFGKGSETVLDTSVRSAWEIDADQIEFRNKDWAKFIGKVVETIKPDLGIEEYPVTANLYKLLIYEQDDFFVAHKDSEKEKGMFGTLIVTLPSAHSGGELLVRFDGREEVVDFSEPASRYKISFAAFYADCEHEIKPVASGNRVCLVYNLIHNKIGEEISHVPLSEQVEQLAAILKTGEEDKDILKIILLGHQYTPANFSIDALKLNDRPKAFALMQAAQKAGFYCKLGLVTSYQMGELQTDGDDYSGRRGYYDDYDKDLENGTMGEVYDEYIRVEHWMDSGVPPLRNTNIEKESLITDITLNEDEPIEKDAEGYTGNAGMEMHYWYHYGAVFLWPKKYHYEILMAQDTANKLEWLNYYNKSWHNLDAADVQLTERLAVSCTIVSNRTNSDFASLVEWLLNMNYADNLPEEITKLLVANFDNVGIEGWLKLLAKYPCSYFEYIFRTSADSGNSAVIKLIFDILNALLTNNYDKYITFIMQQLDQAPDWLNLLTLSYEGEQAKAKSICHHILILAEIKNEDDKWANNIADVLTKNLTRDYVNDVLMHELLTIGSKTLLARRLIEVCKEDLRRRVNNKPQPPADWSRNVPDGDRRVWDILRDFLRSPVQQVFDYKALQGHRNAMENTIRHTTIDLEMETIRKGSPHTLRLTKTQGAYERLFAKWQIDLDLLEKSEAL